MSSETLTATPTATPTAPITMPATPQPTPPATKGRKGGAAGGGKAWTEEEEVYLLQMRLERVAYKKIATHLDKTELACRLHYHQLSHGGNRRKRNNSVSSNSSNNSAASPANSPSAETSAVKTILCGFSPVNAAGAIQKPGSNILPKPKGKPLLPKPSATTPRKSHTIHKGKQLRVNCCPETIDKEKLKRAVKICEAQFWTMVATHYGGAVDAEYLRKIYQDGPVINSPPTPAISPASQVTSPVATEIPVPQDDTNTTTVATVSEVSTPSSSSAMSPTEVAFNGSEVASIKEETMEEDIMEAAHCKQPIKMDNVNQAFEQMQS